MKICPKCKSKDIEYKPTVLEADLGLSPSYRCNKCGHHGFVVESEEKVKIRKATKKDARKITKLIKKNILYGSINKYTNEQKKGLVKKNSLSTIKERIKNFCVFCAFENKKLIGTIYLGDKYEKEHNVGGLYVSPELIKKGLGKKLLKYTENYAKKKGIKKINLYSLKFSKEFYLKQGYKINKTYFWNLGKTKTKTYGMEKKLK